MSRTYKTDPSWVKVMRKNSPEIKESHDHRFGPCDLDDMSGSEVFWWQRPDGYCGYDVSYYGYHGGFYSRPHRGRGYRLVMIFSSLTAMVVKTMM
jgi:hypothetical protein